MTFTDKQIAMLMQPMPREHVATREGGGGKSLSYIEGHLVMREMNEIFGPGGWSYECEATQVAAAEGVGKSGKPQWRVTYTSRCVLVVGSCRIADYGAGHGIDADFGAAIESAIKEAATDSLKRCCKTLGDRLGLALYDKQQRNVADAQPKSVEPAVVSALILRFEAVKTRPQWDAACVEMKELWPTMDGAQQQAVTMTMDKVKARASKAAA